MTASGTTPAVFLDRDGAVSEDHRHLRSPPEVAFIPETVPSLRLPQGSFKLVIVANQPGIAEGAIGAVKGVEFGAGFAAADMTGSRHNDPRDAGGFLSNHAGGILGGISTGQEIIFRVAVKPTSSISLPQQTTDIHGHEATLRIQGRHDPCICPRVVPVVEAMTCLVLEDHFKRQAAMKG
jgi:hypothetical protein